MSGRQLCFWRGQRDVGDDRSVIGAEPRPAYRRDFAKSREANTLSIATSGTIGYFRQRIGQVK